jgi:hypothetical protein
MKSAICNSLFNLRNLEPGKWFMGIRVNGEVRYLIRRELKSGD